MIDIYTISDNRIDADDQKIAELLADGILEPSTCNCGQCGRMHKSDCAVHNEPALPKGQCDCEDNND